MTPDPLELRLDWTAYWREFQAIHGGDPLPYRGRLLFRDGWTYSATDHAGPEWAPPGDDSVHGHPTGEASAKLRREYWSGHRARIVSELSPRERRLDGLRDLARGKSAPLMIAITVTGDDGKSRAASAPLDLMPLEARIEFLRGARDECDWEIAAIDSFLLSLPGVSPVRAVTLPPVRWADEAVPVPTIAGS